MTERDELIAVSVKPRSTRAGVAVAADGRIVVRVHAAAADGAANRECVEALADALAVPKSSVSIRRGEKSRTKQIAVVGLTGAEAQARLQAVRDAK